MAFGNSSEGRLNLTLESAAQAPATTPRSEASSRNLRRRRRSRPGNLVVSMYPLGRMSLSIVPATVTSLPRVHSHEREIRQNTREDPSRPVTTPCLGCVHGFPCLGGGAPALIAPAPQPCFGAHKVDDLTRRRLSLADLPRQCCNQHLAIDYAFLYQSAVEE